MPLCQGVLSFERKVLKAELIVSSEMSQQPSSVFEQCPFDVYHIAAHLRRFDFQMIHGEVNTIQICCLAG